MRRVEKGMTFIEMVIALSVFSIVSMAAYPLAENTTRRAKELELRESLRTMRKGIDRYYADRERGTLRGTLHERYPSSLEELVEKRYLRRIPVDPMTGEATWSLVSTTDEFTGQAGYATDGRNVFDVRSRSREPSASGRLYSTW